jgi:hypothetical protein
MRRLIEWYVFPRYETSLSRWVPLIGVLIPTLLYIFWSAPYVRIDNTSGRFVFLLPANFKTIRLQLDGPIAATGYEVSGLNIEAIKHFGIRQGSLDPRDQIISIGNDAQPERASVPAEIAYVIQVVVLHRSPRPVDILKVELDGTSIELSQLQRDYLRDTSSELLRRRYVQDWLESALTTWNRDAGNYVVTAMSLLALWMSFGLVPRLSLYVGPKAAYHKLLQMLVDGAQKVPATAANPVDAARRHYIDFYARTIANQRFWRALGPALGFLFTVTSLVAGIRPIPGGAATAQMGTLFSSLQLALISTVAGLVMRIAAMARLRLEHALMEDAQAFFDEEEFKRRKEQSRADVAAPESIVAEG